MSSGKCIICGGGVPEGWQVCGFCVEAFEPNTEIINAMLNKKPVEFRGNKFGCISAFTIRTRASHLKPLGKPYIVQAEIMSAKNHLCVTVADPREIKILKEF